MGKTSASREEDRNGGIEHGDSRLCLTRPGRCSIGLKSQAQPCSCETSFPINPRHVPEDAARSGMAGLSQAEIRAIRPARWQFRGVARDVLDEGGSGAGMSVDALDRHRLRVRLGKISSMKLVSGKNLQPRLT